MSIRFLPAWMLVVCALLPGVGSVAAQSPDPVAADAAQALEPGRADLLRAYGERIAAVNTGAGDVLAPEEAAQVRISLQDVQKLLCKRIEREGLHFDCRVEARLRIADQRPKTSIVNLWMENVDGAWVAR